ncbi:uncharacterized protein EI97DRAFT_280193 [Westerdykella ornata]|uniref:Uncharacterized protein n=1 Tax=Westerdykella ornata TaxID=318751 RepID=A0A6A6JP08_WESOR|nr:uncharacterized protein EI97DRAFT_280193 [Westerdykella ornata]KAF2277985.1 hypothetical protein EI97DRAFT_280193 [Westerdykella ornata]
MSASLLAAVLQCNHCNNVTLCDSCGVGFPAVRGAARACAPGKKSWWWHRNPFAIHGLAGQTLIEFTMPLLGEWSRWTARTRALSNSIHKAPSPFRGQPIGLWTRVPSRRHVVRPSRIHRAQKGGRHIVDYRRWNQVVTRLWPIHARQPRVEGGLHCAGHGDHTYFLFRRNPACHPCAACFVN